MQKLTIGCLIALAACVVTSPTDTYTDRYDNLNIKEILSNRRLLIPYLKCFLDQGRCSPDGKEFKKNTRESLETDCGKCTEKQIQANREVLTHLVKYENDYWQQLKAKYDPENKYSRKFDMILSGA